MGVEIESEVYTHFWHAPVMNKYVALKDNGSLKIRGLYGFDKASSLFKHYHINALIMPLIKEFLLTGD